jgi:hypothetical protein
MMDDGLLMIWGKAMAVGGGWRSLPPSAPNKANLPRFWAKNVGGVKKQSQSAALGRARQIRNPKLETRNKPKMPMRQTAKASRVDRMSNKANPGRGGLGIDHGLGIIDDLGQETPGGGRHAICRRRAKQTQFVPFMG